MLAILLPVLALTLGGCGGSSSTPVVVNTTPVNGTVAFPAAVAKIAAKSVAATAGPVLTITDMSGAVIATPTLTAVTGSTTQYTYSVNLPPGKDYVLKATWGGQVLKGLADATSLTATSLAMNIDPASTAQVMVIEQKLNFTPGSLGTSAHVASTTLSGTIAALSPATLLQDVKASQSGTTTTYSALITAITNSLTSATPIDPTTATSVVDIASTIATSNVPPVTPNFTSANGTTFTVGTAGSFTVTGTGSFSVAGALPTGVTFSQSTGVLSGTPATGTNATYPLTITASNGGLSATQPFTLTVNAITPQITSANSTAFTVGTAGSFTITGIGSFSVTAGTLPSGVTFSQSTGVLSGTPAAGTNGSYPITITASNGGLTATQTFTLTVIVATPTYSNASLSGVWLMGGGSQNNLYIVSDGNGSLSASGNFNPGTPPGTYSVQANGTYSLTINSTYDGAIPFTGTLTSSTAGTIAWAGGSGTISKVASLSATQGTWSGTVMETTAHAISLTVDATGTITSSTGFTGTVTGKMFSQSGNVVAFFTTGATDAFKQVNITGTLSGSTITGSVYNEGTSSSAVATVTLTKQ